MQTTQVDGAFLAMMQNHRQGAGLSDLSEAMRSITNAVNETGRPGSFTLKVTIKPAARSAGLALVVEDEVKTSPPKPEKQGSIFFGNEDGCLLRDNPKQLAMQFKTIEVAPAEVTPLKEVADQ